MKYKHFKRLILEEFIAMQEEDKMVIDEIGKFFVVKKPTKGSTKDTIMIESTVFDDINKEEIIGVYKQKSDASRIATEAIKSFDEQLKEVEASMEEYRNAKNDIDSKKQKTKDLILKIK